MKKPFSTSLPRVVAVTLIVLLAFLLREIAVQNLPVDYDEDDYLRAGQLYANGIRQGDWGVFQRENYRTEHPPLSKILFGLAQLTVPPTAEIPDLPVTAEPNQTLPKSLLLADRRVSSIATTLEVLALAVINPLAGFFLAVHTFTIKYSAQVMLEGIPSLTSILVVAFYLLDQRANRKKPGWLLLSALALGLTVSAKYYYAVTGLAVGIHWFWSVYRVRQKAHMDRPWLHPLIAVGLWGLLAFAIFILFNPYLWPDPVGRLAQSITYHSGYAQSEQVKNAAFPFWQPLNWLALSVPWNSEVFLIRIDLLILLFALSGVRRAKERHPVFLLWLALGLSFLLLWPTKWPQYILMITAPVCLVAADGFTQHISEPVGRWLKRLRHKAPATTPQPAQVNRVREYLPWLLPGLLALAAITLFPLIYQLAMSMTDFSASAIRDGVNGGVWRELWLGLTGQVKPAHTDIFSGGSSTKVHFTGLGALLGVLFGAGDYYVFEIVWTVLSILTQTALGMGVAMLLHRRGIWFTKFWQVVFILPWAVPEFVAALAWSQIFDARFGFLSLAAKPWGQQAPGVTNLVTSWQENPNTALLVLLIAALWYGFPVMLLSARAGLKLIPVEVYDAAALDGAAGWQLFRHVTWPLVFPLLVPAIILRAIFAFNQFYLFTVLQTPVITLSAISYWVMRDGRYAASAAINIVTVIILIGLVAWFNRISKAGEGVTYA